MNWKREPKLCIISTSLKIHFDRTTSRWVTLIEWPSRESNRVEVISLTIRFIASSRPQNEKSCKNESGARSTCRNSSNPNRQFFVQTEIFSKNLALANVNHKNKHVEEHCTRTSPSVAVIIHEAFVHC